MKQKVRLVTGIVVLALLAFAGPMLAQEVSGEPEVLKITAPSNVYAHVHHPFPDVRGEDIEVEARFKPMENSGSSWVASLALYWADNQTVMLGVQANGVIRNHGYGVSLSSTTPDPVGVPEEWTHVRIRLVADTIELWAKGDGDWTLIRTRERPDSMAGSPSEIIVGKGFAHANWPEEHLDNSHATPGAVGVAYADDVVVRIDGEQVFYEGFKSLDAWGIHFDPQYEEDISIEIVPLPL